MNETQDWSRTLNSLPGTAVALPPTPRSSDPVVRALEDYLLALQSGERPNRDEFLRLHPDLPPHVVDCLAGLDFVHATAFRLHPSVTTTPATGATQDAARLGPTLNDYRIVREIGRGGMGVVYEAEQVSLGRRVALKILPFAAALDPRRLQRFVNEARAVAQLHHAHVVPIFANGHDRGVHYYVMQLIEGLSLDAVIHELQSTYCSRDAPAATSNATTRVDPGQNVVPLASLEPARLANAAAAIARLSRPTQAIAEELVTSSSYVRNVAIVGVKIAAALHYAHQQGVIHRDVKPGNILLDVRGEPWITDFGLAQFQPDLGLTLTGTLLGTLRYVSPEQALALRLPVDARTDVYSLGVTLYELLTLTPAVPGKDRQEVLHQLAFEEPRAPRRLNRAIPSDLETIVLKAMAKNPDERFLTAQDLADDLQRFLDDRPILAKRPPVVRLAARWARRHWRGALVAAAFTVVVGGAIVFALLADHWRQGERVALDSYQRQVNDARALRQARGIGYKQAVWAHLAVAMAVDSPLRDLDQLRQEAADCLGDWRGLTPTTLCGFPTDVCSVALHPMQPLVAVGLLDGVIVVRDARRQQDVALLPGDTAPVRGLAFSADGSRLFSASSNGQVTAWTIDDRQQATPAWTTAGKLGVHSSPALINGIILTTSAGQVMAVGSVGDSSIALFDPRDGKATGQVHLPQGAALTCFDLSSDGKALVASCTTTDGGGSLLLWDLAKPDAEPRTLTELGLVRGVAFDPTGKLLACTCENRGFTFVDVPTFQSAKSAANVHEGYDFVRFGQGQRLVVANRDQAVLAHVVDDHLVADSAAQRRTLRPYDGTALRDSVRGEPLPAALAYSGDGQRFATATARSVTIWDLARLTEKWSLPGHARGLNDLTYHPDGHWLASCGQDHAVRVWDARSGDLLKLFDAFSGPVRSIAFAHQGGTLLAVGEDGSWLGWRTTDWQKIPVRGPKLARGVAMLRCVVNGPALATTGGDGTYLWQLPPPGADGFNLADPLRLGEQPGGALTFCPAGKLLAWAATDGVHVWDLAAGRELGVLPSRLDPTATSLHFHPDGSVLTFVSAGGVIESWDVRRNARVASLGKPGDFLTPSNSLALSGDGRWFAGRSRTMALDLWDLQTGKRILTLPDRDNPAGRLAFSPKGDQLAVGSAAQGSLRIWNLTDVRDQLAKLGLGW